MRSMGLEVKEPQIIAKTGWSTDELKSAIDHSEVQSEYDWVTVLIGVNNQYRNRDAEEYRKELRELLEYAIRKANGNPKRVLVLSIPDWGVTPFAEGKDRAKIAKEIDTYNRVKREETHKPRCMDAGSTVFCRSFAKRWGSSNAATFGRITLVISGSDR